MPRPRWTRTTLGLSGTIILLAGGLVDKVAAAPCAAGFLSGPDAVNSDWSIDRPGLCRLILPSDLPAPSESKESYSTIIPRPAGAWPQVPPGFTAVEYFWHPDKPRMLRTAPNGDIFVAESYIGAIRVLRPTGVCRPGESSVFARGLSLPFGIAFYPPGPNPQYVYVAENHQVVRYPYRNGSLVATVAPEVVVTLPQGAGQLPGKGHHRHDEALLRTPQGRRYGHGR